MIESNSTEFAVVIDNDRTRGAQMKSTMEVRALANDFAENLSVLRARLDAVQQAVRDTVTTKNLETMRQMKLAEAEVESDLVALCMEFLSSSQVLEPKGEEQALLLLLYPLFWVF
jgi:hypothetical protein